MAIGRIVSVPARVLVVRLDKVGDLVLATPALRNLRDAWPEGHIAVMVSPQNAGVLTGCRAVDELIVYDVRWNPARRMKTLWTLAHRGFDLAIVLSPALDGFVAAALTGARRRGGVVYSRRVVTRLLSRLLTPARTIVHVDEAITAGDTIPHEVDQSLAALRGLGVLTRPVPLELAIDPRDRAWAAERLGAALRGRPFAALHLSPLWFAEGGDGGDLQQLVEDLVERTPVRSVVVTHGLSDARAFQRLRDRVALEPLPSPDAAIHHALGGRMLLIGDVSFGRWAALLEAARIVVTRDTGSLHVAAAAATPVVAIYEARTFAHCSQQWSPWMVPHRSLRAAPWRELGGAIVAAVNELLAASATPRDTGERLQECL